MKRILFFVSDFRIGISSLLTSQAMAFSSIGEFRFSFVGSDAEQVPGLAEKFRGYELFRIPALDEHRDVSRLLGELHRIVDEKRIEIVHVQNNWQLFLVCLLKIRYLKTYRIVYTIHGFRNNYRLKSYVARFVMGSVMLAFVDKVIAASGVVREKFSFLGPRLHILPLGVDDRFYASEHSYDENCFTIIFPAQFRHGKNHEMLIRAVSRLNEAVRDPNIKLVLPGDGPNRADCENLAESLGMKDAVLFPGLVGLDALRDMYNASSIAVVPTNNETFGHCIAEPFVMGRCVISRRVGVAVDIIEDQRNGFIFDTEDELVGILQRLYRDRGLMRRCAERAYASRQVFNWDEITRRYREIISGD
jgi:glycosyltransferase involved in cell wall biosynthesis